MCGFIGNFGCNKNHTKDVFHKIVHRGPDHQSINSSNNWNIEFCRLSINDLSSDGNQPFINDKIISFVNGEIYNFKNLKKEIFKNIKFKSNSDCEIIPHMYKKFGIDFIKYLDGMFSIVLIDEEKKKLFLIKDSFGKKPLYYKKTSNCSCIQFCSEQRLDKESLEIEPENLKTLLFHHFKFFDQTLFKDFFSIPPGCYLEYHNEKIKITKWYNIKKIKLDNVNIEKKFVELFDNSIKKRLLSDVKMGVFLSGGIDSNLIVKSLNKIGAEDIETFSAIIDQKISLEKNDTDTVEKIKSTQIDNKFKNNFIDLNFKYLDNYLIKMITEADHPIIDSSYIIAYACAKEAKEANRKVVLAGVAADECFGSYEWQSRYKKNNKIVNLLVKHFSNFNSYFINSQNRIVNFFSFPYFLNNSSLGLQYWKDKNLEFIKDVKLNTYKSTYNYVKENEFSFRNDFKNLLDYLNLYGVINHQVTIYDLACMLNSIENRSPFLDREFFEFCFSISSKYKIPKKKLLKNLSSSYFNKEFLRRSKSGPTINYNIFFENKFFAENFKIFILKNLYIIENYISKKLAYKIKSDFNLLFNEKYLAAMSIFKIIIWFKFNIEKSINKNSSVNQIIMN